MAVIPHHPVIVHFECVGCSLFTIDDDLAVLFLQCVAFIISDNTAVECYVLRRKLNSNSFFGNGHGAKIIPVPLKVYRVVRKYPLAGIQWRNTGAGLYISFCRSHIGSLLYYIYLVIF